MPSEELRAGLTLDLTELSARLQVQETRVDAAERKVVRTGAKLHELEHQHSALDKLTHRLEHKIEHAGKLIIKAGLQVTAASVLGEMEAAGKIGLLGAFAGSVGTGLLFGGIPGAAQSAGFFVIRKIEHQVIDIIREIGAHSHELAEHKKKLREQKEELESRLAREEGQRIEERLAWFEELDLKFRNATQELIYQTGLQLAQDQLAKAG